MLFKHVVNDMKNSQEYEQLQNDLDKELCIRASLLPSLDAQETSSLHNLKELFPEIVSRSKIMTSVLQLVCKVSRSSSSVLVLGESGTGKELISAALHRLSDRAQFPFVTINCSAIPEDLLEAELFGHEKGAFTGADRKRIGYFGAADKGTIFLDEIGDMPLRLQAKLLRVLQEKQYSPIGSSFPKNVDVRVIAATNIDLENAVKGNKFRLDLFYRLNVLPIKLPSLKEREEDIEFLIDEFLERANRLNSHKASCWFNREAIETLKEFSWPGNVRQLQNLVERLVITKDGCITKEELPEEFLMKKETVKNLDFSTALRLEHSKEEMLFEIKNLGELPKEGLNLCKFIEDLENSYIKQALLRTGNNKNQAAKLLQINRTTLVERLRKRKIDL